jgi:hypothetical protein
VVVGAGLVVVGLTIGIGVAAAGSGKPTYPTLVF